MAKGGGKRSYTRDSNGRFASSGGKSGATKGGTLAARSSLKRSKAKNVPGASRQQAGAVTRAKSKLSSAMKSSKRTGPAMAGVIRGGAAKKAKADASSATSKGRSKELVKQFLASGKKAAKPMAKKAAPAKAAPKRTPKGSGGTSVAAGRKAKEKWEMKRANQRFKKSRLPAGYSPKQTRKIRRVGNF
jgi:hypothetical protein